MSQTHGMRSQKFGVEIETKGLGLTEAARVIAGALRGEARGTYVSDPETGKTWKAVPDGSLHGVSAEEEKKAALECGIALKEERVKTYERLARQAVEVIEKSFPNIVAKNASDIKALLSEVRELCRLTSIELGQYRPGGGPVVAVRTDVTLEDIQEAYTRAQEVPVDEIAPPRSGTLISDTPEEDELENAPDEVSAIDGEVLEEVR